MQLSGWIDAYLDHLRVERALSKNTLDAYARDLGQLLAEVGDLEDPRTIDLEALARLLVKNGRRGLSARSSARQLSALTGFFKFLLKERVIETLPTRLLDAPKLAKRLPQAMNRREVDGVLGIVPMTKARGVRDAAMLHLLYASGLRVTELCTLKLQDLDAKKGVVSVLGKGGKRRTVPVGQVALEHIEKYLTEVRPGLAKPLSQTLFLGPSGKPLTRQAVFKFVKNYVRSAGVMRNISPHKFRHTFATHLLEGGADLRAVQAMLGHADLGTTEIYTRIAQDHVKKAHRTSHPRG